MMTKEKPLAQALMEEDEYECDIFAIRAEGIVRELIKTAHRLLRRGYGTTNLVFSDCSFVSLTDSGVVGEVEALLRAGHKPLGFIAPDRYSNCSPFAESWERGDKAALAELRRLAHWLYGHRLKAGQTQQ
jgi:hypothetical protein